MSLKLYKLQWEVLRDIHQIFKAFLWLKKEKGSPKKNQMMFKQIRHF